MKKKAVSILALALALTFSLSALSGCKKQKLDNEVTPFVIATTQLDGVFNPFFATSGNDMNIIDVTQVSLIKADKDGKPAYGRDTDTVALDMIEKAYIPATIKPNDYSDYYSTYEFLIKNDIRFSDNSLLTIKDVLFSFYVFLDPAYTGSSTMYSTKIKGLKQYQGQSYDPGNYTNANEALRSEAKGRLSTVMQYCNNQTALTSQIGSDIEILKKLIKEELTVIYTMCFGQVETTHEEFPEITKAWEVFFKSFGFITVDNVAKTVKDWQGYKDFDKKYSNEDDLKEAAVALVFNGLFPSQNLNTTKLNLIGFVWEGNGYWATAEDYFVAVVGTEKYADMTDLDVPSVSGITTYKTKNFNGAAYSEEHYVLRVEIEGVDPKARWNFAVPVVPRKYYTSEELYRASEQAEVNEHYFDFGVKFYNLPFMDAYVRGRDVPVGAGPYMASTKNGAANPQYKDFSKDGVVYLQRNPYFCMGPAKIKYISFKVISSNSLYDAVKQGEVHYSQPTVKKETMENLSSKKTTKDFASYQTKTLGYGYIGINAKYVPDLAVRKAIMHAMDTSLCMSYFLNDTASPIYRPMSTVSWAYPSDVTKPYYTYDKTGATSETLIKSAGWTKTGKYFEKNGKVLDFVFTLASENTDHPAWQTMNNAKRILEGIGCKVTLVNDKDALTQLAAGGLQVWAAAWGSTIDPDMYQVYHKDSKASSVLNWGYPSLLTKGTDTEKTIINNLSKAIEQARSLLENKDRIPYYRTALEEVMKLAVELPTYQRNDLYVYNKTVISQETMPTDNEVTSYTSPLQRIWEISFNV